MKKKRILALHLLNDYSGSPFVLRQSLEALLKDGYSIDLFTATPTGEGFLSNLYGVKQHHLFYKWSRNKLVTLFYFLCSQFLLFFRILWYARKQDMVYINSLLPFGGALAGRCRGCKVVYHIHEVSIKPLLLKRWLLFVANNTAHTGIFVSKDLWQRTAFRKPFQVIYNALPVPFTQKAIAHHAVTTGLPFTVLMACSLKKYKGVDELIKCAIRMPVLRFILVLNANTAAIRSYFGETILPENIEIVPACKDLHPYYQEADLVMNLSLPEAWIETFGMTILEAMYYKIPVIIPPVGGITELVTDGVEGFHVHAADTDTLCMRLEQLSSRGKRYQEFSANAFAKAQNFSQEQFSQAIIGLFASIGITDINSGQRKYYRLPLFGKRVPNMEK
ncbi:MAG: glycosyltransferase family 4 protein [Bacteroidetes bacterium]|nr:glycosyltransferase family 4 protein [Bacteroidota bacterium]